MKGGVDERVKKMATKLAMVSLREWVLSGVKGLVEKKIKGDCQRDFKESLFKTVAKLILYSFDLEDLERFNMEDELLAEYKRFYVENLSQLKVDDNPYKLVAKGKIRLDCFPLLGEPDIGRILQSYKREVSQGRMPIEFSDMVPNVWLMNFGNDDDLGHCCFKEGLHGHFVEMARSVMLQYVPLEENIKLHSILECVFYDCRCTLYRFVDEAISELIWKDDELTEEIIFCLSCIITERLIRLPFVSYPVSSFVVYGETGTAPFRSFAREVYDLVEIANACRRLQCHRFISKNHILWAAKRFTIYKASINKLIEDFEFGDLVEVPAARQPPYSLYLSALAIADYLGTKLASVEHIVVAIIYEMSKVRRSKIDLCKFIRRGFVRKFFHDVEDIKNSSSGSIFMKFDTEIIAGDKKGEIATQNSFHCLELEILSMTVDAISLEISQQVILQDLADDVENVKVSNQPISYTVLVENSGKIVTSQPEVFYATSFPSMTDFSGLVEREVEERVMKLATRLAMVSLRKWMLSDVDGSLEKKWGNREAFEEESFKSVAKLILCAYDMEDLERFNSRDMLWAEYKRFYDENLSHLKSNENPYKLVAKGRINFDGFPLLREQDVGLLLAMYSYQVENGTVGSGSIYMVKLMSFGSAHNSPFCFKEGLHGRFVEMARSVLLQYFRLDDDIKMHTILDSLVCHCVGPLKGSLHDVFDVLGIKEWKDDEDDMLTWSIYDDLGYIAREKLRLRHTTWLTSAADFVRHTNNSFAKEVSEFVMIADARRRFEGHCFISNNHIIWAACRFTVYKELIENLFKDLKLELSILVEGPAARRPPYNVYMLASDTADFHGVKLATIDHIIVATVLDEFNRSKTSEWLKMFVDEFNRRTCVKKFLSAAKECRERRSGSHVLTTNVVLPGKPKDSSKVPVMVNQGSWPLKGSPPEDHIIGT